MNKEYFLKVFPTLEFYWDKDGGSTVLKELRLIRMEKKALYSQWNQVKQGSGLELPLVVFDVENLCIRLIPDEEDVRPYCTKEDIEEWEDLMEQTLGAPVYLERGVYLRTMEKIFSYKFPDKINCELMEKRLQESFAFQESALEENFLDSLVRDLLLF